MYITIILVLIDISATFGTIDHRILLDRLENWFGVTGPALCWFQSYLNRRTQSVVVEDSQSEPKVLSYGVPQGSVLGPILFNCYIAPLASVVSQHGVEKHTYAGDNQLYLAIELKSPTDVDCAIDQLESCIECVRTWMRKNWLQLNDDKTEVLVFASSHKLKQLQRMTPNMCIAIGDKHIQLSQSVRNLGIIQDSELQMDQHVTHVIKQCNLQLSRNISRIHRYLTMEATKSIVHALVTSRLDYGNALLFGISGKQLCRLQKIQNCAARLIAKIPRTHHISPVLVQLHWLPVHRRIEFKILVHTYRALNDTAPQYLSQLIVPYTPTRALRSQEARLLTVPRRKKVSFVMRAFSAAAPKLWNALPGYLRCAPSLESFKKSLKHHLFVTEYNTD